MSVQLPKARCKACASTARAIKFTNFAYWYCDTCKDEVEVSLATIKAPKGEIYGYVFQPQDIAIGSPGLWHITYVDGSDEWYEHEVGQRDLRLRGEDVVSATRIADRDMPSRKRVQPLSGPGEGASSSGLSLRTVPDAPDSLSGGPASDAEMLAAIRNRYWVPGGNIKIKYAAGTDSYITSINGCEFLKIDAEEVRELVKSHRSIQLGQVPPDDSL
jgi:hypothetical protein